MTCHVSLDVVAAYQHALNTPQVIIRVRNKVGGSIDATFQFSDANTIKVVKNLWKI